jgi:hypothetical protein
MNGMASTVGSSPLGGIALPYPQNRRAYAGEHGHWPAPRLSLDLVLLVIG